MTKQEVFDKVAGHLLKQGRKSYNQDTGVCCFRTSEGLSCAVGCLIPDEVYREDMESSVSVVEVVYEIGHGQHAPLLLCLQLMHDNVPPARWKSRLKDIAAQHRLSFNEEQ